MKQKDKDILRQDAEESMIEAIKAHANGTGEMRPFVVVPDKSYLLDECVDALSKLFNGLSNQDCTEEVYQTIEAILNDMKEYQNYAGHLKVGV